MAEEWTCPACGTKLEADSLLERGWLINDHFEGNACFEEQDRKKAEAGAKPDGQG